MYSQYLSQTHDLALHLSNGSGTDLFIYNYVDTVVLCVLEHSVMNVMLSGL